MKKPNQKKTLPPWVPVVVIAAVVVIVIAVYLTIGGGGHKKPTSRDKQLEILQQRVNEYKPLSPLFSRTTLEKRGVVFPPDYDQKVAAQAGQDSGPGRGPMRGR